LLRDPGLRPPLLNPHAIIYFRLFHLLPWKPAKSPFSRIPRLSRRPKSDLFVASAFDSRLSVSIFHLLASCERVRSAWWSVKASSAEITMRHVRLPSMVVQSAPTVVLLSGPCLDLSAFGARPRGGCDPGRHAGVAVQEAQAEA